MRFHSASTSIQRLQYAITWIPTQEAKEVFTYQEYMRTSNIKVKQCMRAALAHMSKQASFRLYQLPQLMNVYACRFAADGISLSQHVLEDRDLKYLRSVKWGFEV